MRLFRPLPLLLLTVGAACTDAPTPPKTALTPVVPTYSLTAAADFHRTNKHDWVGMVHNRGLDRLFAKIAKHHGPTDVCGELAAMMSDPELIPVEHRGELTPAVTARALQSLDAFCPQQVGQADAGIVSLAQSTPALSPAAEAIVVQLRAANDAAANSTDLANRYNAILPATAALSGPESDAVNAGASVGLSSMEYWEVNYTGVDASTQSSYGNCIQASTTDANSTILTCVGMTAPPKAVLVGFEGATPLLLIQDYPTHCQYGSFGALWELDFETGIGAAVGAAFSGPGAISAPAVGGLVGLSSSGAYAIWNSAKAAWCRYHSGGTPANTKKT